MTVEVPHSRQNAVHFFERFVHENKETLRTKTVVDLSAGSGYIANLFYEAGASVSLYDLFPEQNTFCPVPCRPIDLQVRFPIDPGSVDIAILGETIEHLPDQYHFFQEVSRILRPGGCLLLTTPNSSSLRSRLSQFLMESEHYSTPPPNETDAFTRWPHSERGYFSKLFISGVLRLRTLAALQSLKIRKVHPTPSSSTSWLLMVFYPFIYFFSRKNLRRQKQRNPKDAPVFEEIFRLNTSTAVLTSKHLIIEFEKEG